MASQFRDHAFPTNGDGFGVAWLGRGDKLGQYRQETPAWDSQNLRHLAAHIESGCFLAHVRAAPGGTISQQNAHPFVHDGWMFQHNGEVNGFAKLKRDLTLDVDPNLYPFIQGNSDTEVCFFLALTYGLQEKPEAALVKMVQRVERARSDHGVAEPFRATMCASDGRRLVVLRWVSPDAHEQAAPSLFTTTGGIDLRTTEQHSLKLPDDSHLVVSEPLELHWSNRVWHEVPNRHIGTVEAGKDPVFTPIEY